jgi:hypothetical protein
MIGFNRGFRAEAPRLCVVARMVKMDKLRILRVVEKPGNSF